MFFLAVRVTSTLIVTKVLIIAVCFRLAVVRHISMGVSSLTLSIADSLSPNKKEFLGVSSIIFAPRVLACLQLTSRIRLTLACSWRDN